MSSLTKIIFLFQKCPFYPTCPKSGECSTCPECKSPTGYIAPSCWLCRECLHDILEEDYVRIPKSSPIGGESEGGIL